MVEVNLTMRHSNFDLKKSSDDHPQLKMDVLFVN